jgi:hypothetical protein
MTPEELNRTIEFIIASQARLAAAQEHDRQDSKANDEKFERLVSRVVRLQDQQAQLLVYQSERLDRFEKFQEDWLRRNEDFQKQALRLLNTLLDRLPPGLGSVQP